MIFAVDTNIVAARTAGDVGIFFNKVVMAFVTSENSGLIPAPVIKIEPELLTRPENDNSDKPDCKVYNKKGCQWNANHNLFSIQRLPVKG